MIEQMVIWVYILTGEREHDRETHEGIDLESDCYTLSEGRWVSGATPRMLQRRSRAAASWTKKGLFVTGNIPSIALSIQKNYK